MATTLSNEHRPDPALDLLLERVVDVPREMVWAAWTKPEHLVKWFAPAPFETTTCEIDLRPGGVFRTVMRSPEGEEHATTACYLEVVDQTRLVWTTVLGPGFRPAGQRQPETFTAVISLEAQGQATKYSALAMHADPANCERHAEMGFHDGWGAALDQLVGLFGRQA